MGETREAPGKRPSTMAALDVGGWSESWLSSSLDLVSVVEVVTILVGAGLSGALYVQGPTGTRRLFFAEGHYRGGMSDHKEDRLGEVLWRKGNISLDQLMIAAESITRERKIGRVLVDLGFIDVGELRPALREQAREVFEAACLEEVGRVTFRPGEVSPNPVTFLDEPEAMIDSVLALIEERERLRTRLGDLTRPFRPASPAPTGTLEETAEALRQLAVSAKGPLAAEALLDKANLRTLAGLRALDRLVTGGWLEPVELFAEPLKTRGDARPRLDRLVEAVQIVMARLDERGFGLGDAVRDYCASPPAEVEGALAGVDLAHLDADTLRKHGELFIDGGVEALERGLSLLLDFALFEARDTTDEDEMAALLDSIAHLGVLI